MTAAVPVQRGCGSRKEGAVYLESGLVAGGMPIEHFLFDPPLTHADGLPAAWLQPSRTPQLFERDGVHHVVIWVGEDFYSNVFDFIEETRVAGASRRVPRTFDFSKLSADSRMYFVHAHALVDGTDLMLARRASAETQPELMSTGGGTCCPKRVHYFDAFDGGDAVRCLGLAKYLPTINSHDYRTENVDGSLRVRALPCGHTYEMPATPLGVPMLTAPAMFMMLPLTGIALVEHHDGSFEPTVEQRVREANGVDVFRTDK